ncbi:MAG: hypothetical protein EOO68_04810 [Moraxellaceae bacterium]|nr:MAG: hypothetical protein EOO68_04810 [Moraxellaceae bacterium]
MFIPCKAVTKVLAIGLTMFTPFVYSQETITPKKDPVPIDITKEDVPIKTLDTKVDTTKAQPAKKMVQDATINLQTTITGNQEQPRVLYILPWQSPLTTSVDFEPLDSQQKAVFNHVEREELRRELESSGELQ